MLRFLTPTKIVLYNSLLQTHIQTHLKTFDTSGKNRKSITVVDTVSLKIIVDKDLHCIIHTHKNLKWNWSTDNCEPVTNKYIKIVFKFTVTGECLFHFIDRQIDHNGWQQKYKPNSNMHLCARTKTRYYHFHVIFF